MHSKALFWNWPKAHHTQPRLIYIFGSCAHIFCSNTRELPCVILQRLHLPMNVAQWKTLFRHMESNLLVSTNSKRNESGWANSKKKNLCPCKHSGPLIFVFVTACDLEKVRLYIQIELYLQHGVDRLGEKKNKKGGRFFSPYWLVGWSFISPCS